MKRKEAIEIAKKFPEIVRVFPRVMFEEQLADFIMKEKFEVKNDR